MKRGIILTRKHGGKELTALGPALPYHEQVARFKKEFQSNHGAAHDKYEEVILVPVEPAAAKRVRFFTEKRAAEIAQAQTVAVEAFKAANALSDEIKSAMADVAAAQNKVEHFEKALLLTERNTDPETKAKNLQLLSDRIESAKAELKQAKAVLKKAEAKTNKADAKAESEAEAETPTQKQSETK